MECSATFCHCTRGSPKHQFLMTRKILIPMDVPAEPGWLSLPVPAPCRWPGDGARGKTSPRWTTRSWAAGCAITTTRTSSTRRLGSATCTASCATCTTCWATPPRSCTPCWASLPTPRTDPGRGHRSGVTSGGTMPGSHGPAVRGDGGELPHPFCEHGELDGSQQGSGGAGTTPRHRDAQRLGCPAQRFDTALQGWGWLWNQRLAVRNQQNSWLGCFSNTTVLMQFI